MAVLLLHALPFLSPCYVSTSAKTCTPPFHPHAFKVQFTPRLPVTQVLPTVAPCLNHLWSLHPAPDVSVLSSRLDLGSYAVAALRLVLCHGGTSISLSLSDPEQCDRDTVHQPLIHPPLTKCLLAARSGAGFRGTSETLTLPRVRNDSASIASLLMGTRDEMCHGAQPCSSILDDTVAGLYIPVTCHRLMITVTLIIIASKEQQTRLKRPHHPRR